MGRLIMWNLVTLDGYFDGPARWQAPWQLDWHRRALEGDFFQFAVDQLHSADMLLFGRVTYEGMAGYWRSATDDIARLMNCIAKTVFSRTLDRAEWQNTTLVRDDAAGYVAAMKQRVARDIYVFGSADLSRTLMNAGLFDEVRLGVTSIVLGNGRMLFGDGTDPASLDLIEARTLSAGCVVLRYQPGKEGVPGSSSAPAGPT
jgi:dihydrofolate reductase